MSPKTFSLKGWEAGSYRFGAQVVVDDPTVIPPPPPPGGGGGGTPPPTGAPGGDARVSPRSISLVDRSGLGTVTTPYDATDSVPNGRRIYYGFANNADLTTSDIAQTTSIYDILNLRSGNDVTIEGGRFRSLVPEDGTTPWDQIGGTGPEYHGPQSIRWEKGLRCLITNVSVRNDGDGIQIGQEADTSMGQCDGSVVRWSALTHMGDDCIENDVKSNVTVYQCLLTACQHIFSARPGNGNPAERLDASNRLYTITGNICRLVPMIYPSGVSHPSDTWPSNTPCVSGFFKGQTDTGGLLNPDGPGYGIKWKLNDNVFLYDGTASVSNRGAWGALDKGRILSGSGNNILLQPNASSGVPSGDWAANAPTAGFTYLYGTAAKNYWNNVVNAWITAHPEVSVTTADKMLFP